MELYEPIHSQFHRYCEVMVKNAEMAKDLQSDVVLTAYESFATLRKPESFKFYLFGIARNLFRKKLRRNKLESKYILGNADTNQQSGDSVEANVDIGLLYEKLELLPKKQKEAIILFEISGFSLKEIREIQGDSLSAVKLRLSRGREKLKELLSDSTVKL
ncbi:MAG: RNA polymerase sigma factor [Flavobacteriales bacterium]|nr:RNA polymerase sigma factor [Flavobacteriales bacterium]